MSKDPETQEFIMVTYYGNEGDLRNYLQNNYNNLSWKDKIELLYVISNNLKNLHKLGYCHNNFHNGNILLDSKYTLINFRLTRLTASNDKGFGVLTYVAPEILNGESCSLASGIYGVIMTELSSGKPPFSNMEHDMYLALEICGGLRPEFEKRTPEIYKELAKIKGLQQKNYIKYLSFGIIVLLETVLKM